MPDLLPLLAKDSLKVADLARLYAAAGPNPALAADALRAARLLDPELAWRAIWLLKRLARDRRLSPDDLLRLADSAGEFTHWAARLNLCQLFGTTGCPPGARETLYPYLVESFANRRPMIRAWAISVLAGFRDDPRYRQPVAALLRRARTDPAGSIRARLRHL